MNDQASRLRILARQQLPESTLFNSRVLAITSGKGGVGKTNVVAGLAMALAQMGERVVLLDADFGLANIDILLDLNPQYTLEHVLKGEKMLEEIMVEGPLGIRIIPASSGIQELTRLDASAELRLIQGLQRISETTEWLLIDTAAGIHDSVIKLLLAAQEVLVVTTPEPTSLVDAYAIVKVVHQRDSGKTLWLLVNNAHSEMEASETIEQLQSAVHRFLGKEFHALGVIPHDPYLIQSVREQRGVFLRYPESPSALALQQISEQLRKKIPLQKNGFASFWNQLSFEEL